MKILVITGSPHKKGTSALLADNFIAGALEAGHEVFRFDTIFQVTQPCLACYYCRKNNHKCIQEDDADTWENLKKEFGCENASAIYDSHGQVAVC